MISRPAGVYGGSALAARVGLCLLVLLASGSSGAPAATGLLPPDALQPTAAQRLLAPRVAKVLEDRHYSHRSLDDALSAVDAETEHRILGELERHTRHLSRVIVSHRLSAVQSADEILVLREGRVVERGTHAALLAGAGWYAQTWRYQQLAASVEQGP